MIVSRIKMIVPPEKRHELLQTVHTLTSSMRKEHGCRSCDFYMDTENVDAFLLIQEWTTGEDFNRHVRAAAFSSLLGALTLLKERPDVRISEVGSTAGMEIIKSLRAGRGLEL